ncbi:MAG: cytochrome b/b6 domain-containing protein [Pseudomonadota bacterium]
MNRSLKWKSRTVDLLLDEKNCPVARMRLLSEGLSLNNRLFIPDDVIGDKGCLSCGNCVDACPVVREKYRFIFMQNRRTSMALENMVGEECRRCYKCIMACPQVTKPMKEYSSAFRRGEKIVHTLSALLVFTLAMTGITMTHYGDFLPMQDLTLLQYAHRVLGALFLLMPVLYLILDRRHMIRFLRRIVAWNRKDVAWLKALLFHIRDHKRYPMPSRGEFNPGQKGWYLYVLFILYPVIGMTGIIQWLGLSYGYVNISLLNGIILIHMIIALITDLLLFLHVYIKYLRNWGIFIFDLIKTYRTKGHLIYPSLYHSTMFDQGNGLK